MQTILILKMQRCKKRSVEASREIRMQKGEKAVRPLFETGMLKSMEPIQKYIWMPLMMRISS